METNTIRDQRKRKLLLFLPLMIMPLMAVLFYAFGGGRPVAQAAVTHKGINTSLPGAKLEAGKNEDKLSLYEQSRRDSVQLRQNENTGLTAWNSGLDTAAESNTKAIRERLAVIDKQLKQPPVLRTAELPGPDEQEISLRKMQQAFQQHAGSGDDPEMKQLNGMLDKLLALQNPQQAAVPLPKAEVKPNSAFKAVPALIEGNQKVAPGGVVKLRLGDTMRIAGMTVPKGQLLFGSCNITNQRLLLNIRNIRLGTAIIPVDLTVFSLDGLSGIDAPEAELGEAAGNGAGNALQGMQFLPMDQSLGTQAAAAGITAAKDLFGKKVRKIRVKLHGGQQVLLRINKN